MNFLLTLRVARSVGAVTFRDLIRDKVLYNSAVFAVLLMILGAIATRLTYVRPERIVLDVGFSAVSITCFIVSVLIGAGLLTKEFDRRTIHLSLSRPVTHLQFITGKYVGLCATVLVNLLLLAAVYLTILYFSVASGAEASSVTLAQGLVLVFIQSMMLGALAILFSTFSTASLSVMITTGIYLIGVNISQIRFLATRTDVTLAKHSLNVLGMVWPNFESFGLGTNITYGLGVSLRHFSLAVIYGLTVTSILIYCASRLMRLKDL